MFDLLASLIQLIRKYFVPVHETMMELGLVSASSVRCNISIGRLNITRSFGNCAVVCYLWYSTDIVQQLYCVIMVLLSGALLKTFSPSRKITKIKLYFPIPVYLSFL